MLYMDVICEIEVSNLGWYMNHFSIHVFSIETYYRDL